MVVNQYCWLLSILKIAYAKRRTYVVVRLYSNKMIRLLDILLDVGFIFSFQKEENNKIKIFLRYTNGVPVFSHLYIAYSSASNETISLKTLRQFFEQDRCAIFIISTSHGLVDAFYCLKHNLGGKLICIIS